MPLFFTRVNAILLFLLGSFDLVIQSSLNRFFGLVTHTLWIELVEKFSQIDVFHILDLQEEMFLFHQCNQSLNSYFIGLKAMLNELDVLIPVPSCVCDANCLCNAWGKVKEQRNILQVTWFLKGLNEQFFAIRFEIMLMMPLPTLNKVFGMIVQQERQFSIEFSNHAKILVTSITLDSM